MNQSPDNPTPESPPAKTVRRPSGRWAAILAAATLGAGIAVGAAIGPAPAASLAGDAGGIARQLPLLIARIEASRSASTATTATSPAEPPASTPEPTPVASKTKAAKPAATTPAAEEEETSKTPKSSEKTPVAKLPAITNVWTIQLSGTSFASAIAAPSAAPYIDTQLLPAATLLSDWSAIDAGAFSSEALLAEPPATGAAPPQLHSIVQPPCPEGVAGAACAPETPGQLTAADEFLKATLATITATSTYKEHGLIVITFATVGIATQSELPPDASTSTLSYQPPAGVALLSPFAKAGARPTAAFNPTSPRRSLEKLLH